MSELLSRLDATVCGEIAMVIFLIVFLSVGARLIFMRRMECDQQAHIPLDDPAIAEASHGSIISTAPESTTAPGRIKRG